MGLHAEFSDFEAFTVSYSMKYSIHAHSICFLSHVCMYCIHKHAKVSTDCVRYTLHYTVIILEHSKHSGDWIKQNITNHGY